MATYYLMENQLLLQLFSSDINECAERTDECDQQCYNTIGSYSCNCTEPGYRLHSDDATCQSEYANIIVMSITKVTSKLQHVTCHVLHPDIDECIDGAHGCAQTCTDTDGNYTCSCDVGYNLANDQHGCDGRCNYYELHAKSRTIRCLYACTPRY